MTKRRVAVAVTIGVLLIALIWLLLARMPSKKISTSTPQQRQQPDALTCTKALPETTLLAQKLMVAAYRDQLQNETQVLAQPSIGGIIAMDAVPASELQAFHTAMHITPFIGVDQEGGTVQRYTEEGLLPGAAAMAASLTTQQAYQAYLRDDAYLKSIGITTNFAPVVGVNSSAQNPLPGRLYSADPSVVSAYATVAVRAAHDAGITPVIKHFPGLGSATGNTDYGPATTDQFSVLQTRDLVPFQQLAKLSPDVMVGNVTVPGLTDGQPAVWSPQAIQVLRQMGYQHAVVYSDSLTARAIPGTLPEAVVKAWQAGIDVALIVQTPAQTPRVGQEVASILSAASAALNDGTLKKDDLATSVARIFARKGIDPCTIPK